MKNIDLQIAEEQGVYEAKKCMRCGKCSASCPAFELMDVKPHRFVHLLALGEIDRLMRSATIKICLSCLACVQRCPRGVAPANAIEAVRTMALRMGDGNLIEPEEIPAQIDENTPQQLLTAAFRKLKR